MKTNDLSFLVGGAAGLGVKTAGLIFARACSRAGLHVFGNVEYPSIIRGGHNSFQAVVSEDRVLAHIGTLDLLLALDTLALREHRLEMAPGAAVVYDAATLKAGEDDLPGTGVLRLDVPMAEIAKSEGLNKPAAANSVGLGAVLGLLQADFEPLAALLRAELAKLPEEILDRNVAAARKGYEVGRGLPADGFAFRLQTVEAPERMLIAGNEALAAGALKAGLRFYAGYPMTPSSSILTFLAGKERDFGLVVKHAEDEIAAIGMAVGASFMGARAMTASSGGGFALMSEFLGLAASMETPLVIAEVQRPGPSTGLPTRTGQGDLKFVLSASQDDFPRVVIAPGDPEECFRDAFEAFNIADRLQTLVLLVSDKHLAESYWTLEPFDTEGMAVDRGEILEAEDLSGAYRRHAETPSGVSPRVRPGTPGGTFATTGNSHDEAGRITDHEDLVRAQMDKRMRKLDLLDPESNGATLHGPEEADFTVVGWGSTKGAILSALGRLGAEGKTGNFLQLRMMNPFPVKTAARVLSGARKVLLVEQNATGQLGDRIAEKTGIRIEERILKYTGRQFLADELADRIREKI